MATWGAHIRIAENILKTKNDLIHKEFIIGNLGPDCNKANETWTSFEPSADITHWKVNSKNIDADLFYEKYLLDNINDEKKKSYLLGYYSHLLTDIEWAKILTEKKNYMNKMKVSYEFTNAVKDDWYDLDHLYFRDNKDSSLFNTLKHVTEFNEFLDYFPQNSTIDKLRYIVSFYDQQYDHLEREYKYLSKNEMDHYVELISEKVIATLIEKNILV